MKKLIYKTVFQVEFLSEEKIDSDESLSSLVRDAIVGDLSMVKTTKTLNKRVIGKTAVAECKKHGSDTEFFGMDEDGNELY